MLPTWFRAATVPSPTQRIEKGSDRLMIDRCPNNALTDIPTWD
jgi:hypothetical protein